MPPPRSRLPISLASCLPTPKCSTCGPVRSFCYCKKRWWSLDPELNIWNAAEPIAKEWVETNYGMAGRLKEAGEGAELVGKVLAEVPRFLEQGERVAQALAETARAGLRLDEETIERLAAAQARHDRWSRRALWVVAALLAVAVWLMSPLG